MKRTVCPACRKTREHYPEGVITLRGEFLNTHKDEILQLVQNENARMQAENPEARIIAVNDFEGSVEVQTTTERFAERLGKEIKRAFKGKISYNWSRGEKKVRVEWHREMEKEKSRAKG